MSLNHTLVIGKARVCTQICMLLVEAMKDQSRRFAVGKMEAQMMFTVFLFFCTELYLKNDAVLVQFCFYFISVMCQTKKSKSEK